MVSMRLHHLLCKTTWLKMATRRWLSTSDVLDYFMNCDDCSDIESDDSDDSSSSTECATDDVQGESLVVKNQVV